MSSAEPPPPKPMPGWYPEPGGTGVQRYFDGTNWGQFASPLSPPPRPPKKSSSPKAILAVVGAIFLLIVVGKACGHGDTNSTSTAYALTNDKARLQRYVAPKTPLSTPGTGDLNTVATLSGD